MSKLKFYKKSHKYKIGKKELISVTTLIGQLFEPFDRKKIARKLAKFPVNRAKKRGVRYWLAEWKESAEHGTRVHNNIDGLIKGNSEEILDKDLPKVTKAMSYYNGKKIELGEVEIYSEMRIYDEELGIAGTIDLVLVKDNEAILIDWKTNKALSRKGYQGKKGIHPLTEDLDDCHITKYGLQLSMYAYLLEKQKGFRPKGLYIPHLKDYYVEQIELPYERDKVKEILEWKVKNDKLEKEI